MAVFIDFIAIILTFIACLTIVIFFKRFNKFPSNYNREYRFSSIDGMRGFLAVFVFIHHFIITWHWKNTGIWSRPPENYYQNFGKVGVALFFMITGFLFISKLINNHNKLEWNKFFESRLFRIFPLYLFCLFIMLIIVGFETSFNLNTQIYTILIDILKWLLFIGSSINDFSDTKLIIAGVDWTLKYEWIFYFSLPLISIIINRGVLFVLILQITILFLFFFPINFFPLNTKLFLFFSIGGFSAYICKINLAKHFNINSFFISSISMLCLISSIFYPDTFDSIHVLIIGVFFVLISLGNNLYSLFSYKSALLLGEITYSVYLIHGIILYFLFSFLGFVDLSMFSYELYILTMPIVCAIVIIISCLSYIFIEMPGIEQGKKYYLTTALSKLNNRS